MKNGPPATLRLAILRLTAEVDKNLSAASGVAYMKSGAILTLLAAPNPAPKSICKRLATFEVLFLQHGFR